jgi:imidazolonepropionase
VKQRKKSCLKHFVRIDDLVRQGITTIEIKSGYGLKLDCELKMLRAINHAKEKHQRN